MNNYHFPDPIKGRRSKKNYSMIYKRDNNICQYCGDSATTIDHIIPWNFKNDNSPENMVASCKICNCIAGDKLFRDFNDKKIYILNRRAQKELGIKDPLQWPDIKYEKDSEFLLAELPVTFIRFCKTCRAKFKTNNEEEKEFCSSGCEAEYTRKNKDPKKIDKGSFRFHGDCKFPGCGKSFKTNREWKEFCSPDCQRKYHLLLKKKHEDVIVEMATLKEDVIKIKNKLGIE